MQTDTKHLVFRKAIAIVLALSMLPLSGFSEAVQAQASVVEPSVSTSSVDTTVENSVQVENSSVVPVTEKSALLSSDSILNELAEPAYTLEKKTIRVLCIYPTDNRIESTVAAYLAANPLPDGLNLTIDSVLLDTFNLNPDLYLKDVNGEIKYDVVTVGVADANNFGDISGLARIALSDYINKGYGFLIGHDTICYNDSGVNPVPDGLGNYAATSTVTPNDGTHWNMDAVILESAKIEIQTLADVGDVGTPSNAITNMLRVRTQGQVVEYPYNLLDKEKISIDGGDYYTLDAFQSHTSWQAAHGEVWLDYSSNAGRLDNTFTEFNGKAATNNFYLTTTGNVGMSQMGHYPQFSDDEMQIYINTLFYLSQPQYCEICNDNESIARVVRDVEYLKELIAADPGGCYVLGSDIMLPANWEPITGFTGHFFTDDYLVNYDAGLDISKQRVFSDSGKLEGNITDQNGHFLSFVPISINDGTNIFEAVTDENGNYSLSGILVGNYTVSINGTVIEDSFQVSATEYKMPIIKNYSVAAEGMLVSYIPDLANVSGVTPTPFYTLPGIHIALLENMFSKENFEFLGWNDGSQTLAEGSDYAIVGSVVFSALWVNHNDIVVPSITALLPDGGRVGQDISLRISAVDNISLDYVSAYFRASGAEEWTLIGQTDAQSGNAVIKWNAAGLNGSYQVKAIATDTSENNSSSDYIKTFTIDTTGIQKIIIKPAQVFPTYVLLSWEDVSETDFAYFQIEQKVQTNTVIDTSAPIITSITSATIAETNTVTTTITDTESGVALQKWAAGTQTADYFNLSGNTYTENFFTVTANGTYTIYAKDNAGNEAVQIATVSNIGTSTDTNIPAIGSSANVPLSGYTRYEDTVNANLFEYENMSYWANGDTVCFFNGNVHHQTDNTKEASVSFAMEGTRFYLIVQCWNGWLGRNRAIDLYIDGIYNQTYTAPQIFTMAHSVYFVSPQLSEGTHTVMLKYNPGISGDLWFDGIDVRGKIIDPALTGDKDITQYSIDGVAGVIDNTAHTIKVDLPAETPINGLVPVFTTSDNSTVKIGSTQQVSGVTSNDFTNPVTYTITAQNGTSLSYLVTISKSAANSGDNSGDQTEDDGYLPIGTESEYTGFYVQDLVPDTSYTYRIVGYDNLGNRGIVSDDISVTTQADTVAPIIKSVLPVQSFYKDSLDLSAVVTDNVGSTSMVFSYSTDQLTWTEIAALDASSVSKEYTYSYNWDISSLPEGRVYVRFTALDAAGNQNVTADGKPLICKYIIDRTPPAAITHLALLGENGYVSLTWMNAPESDIAAYRIYRANAGSDEFDVLVSDCSTTDFYDTSVEYNKEYQYKIAAIDIAGNISEISAAVSVTVLADTEAPVIHSVSPSNGTMVGKNQMIRILATDNVKLAKIKLEFTPSEKEQWETIVSEDENTQNQLLDAVWETTGLNDGLYDFRVTATDIYDNSSQYFTFSYQLDTAAPQSSKLNLTQGNWEIDLSWNQNPEIDFSYYELYRKTDEEADYSFISKLTASTYIDSTVTPDINYSYKLRSVDIGGNYSESNIAAGHANRIDTIAPVARVTENITTVEGNDIALDGTASSDNVGIAKFTWDMGDGTVLEGAQPIYSYSKAGNYSVVLTVEDTSGNTDTSICSVQVYGPDSIGLTTIRVVDSNNVPIKYAYVYIKINEDENMSYQTNEKGEVEIAERPGSYSVAAYKQGYMPKETVMSVVSYSPQTVVIALSSGSLVTGVMTSHRMDLDEMIQAGIDFSNPANIETYKFRVELTFEQKPIPVIYEFICSGGGGQVSIADAPGISFQVCDVSEKNTDTPIPPILAYVKTEQQISWLKDMYAVSLGVINNGDSQFVLENNTAVIDLPSGLSLSATKTDQSRMQGMDNIAGQQQASTSWCVKSDTSGTYDIGASFHGTLMPFGASISADFSTTQTFELQGTGLHIYVMPEEAAYIGDQYYIQFAVVNESSKVYYGLETSFGTYTDPGYKVDIEVTDTASGQTTVYQDEEGAHYVADVPSECGSMGLMRGGDAILVKTFSPGEAIYGTYSQTFTAEGDPNEVYYALIESLVTDLSENNTGVQVTVSPISSHITRYNKVIVTPDITWGDPVDYTTGAYIDSVETLAVVGATTLSLDMDYNSLTTTEAGDLGYGWSHNYECSIKEEQGQLRFYWTPSNYFSFMSSDEMNGKIKGAIVDGQIELSGESNEGAAEFTCINSGMSDFKLVRNENGSYSLYSPNGDSYGFNAEGKLTEIRDANGRTVTLSYVEKQMIVNEAASGKVLYVNYDDAGHIISAADETGRSSSFTYEGEFLATYSNAIGEITRYTYDAEGRILSVTNKDGSIKVANTYDDNGRVITQDDGDVNTPLTVFTYTDDKTTGSTLVEITDRNGGTAAAKVNRLGNLISTKDQNGHGSIFNYDLSGHLISETNAGGNTVSYGYDSNGNRNLIRDMYSNATQITYDSSGNITAITKPDGTSYSYQYDSRNLQISAKDAYGISTTYTYNEAAQITSETVTGKGTKFYEYTNGQLSGFSDFAGNKSYYSYDTAGNMVSYADREGAVSSFDYDLLGRVIEQTNALGERILYTYDTNGNQTSVTDSQGNTTRFIYSYDRLIKQVFADNSEISYLYDNEGNVVQSTDAGGKITATRYDPAGNPLNTTVSGLAVTYTYNANNDLLTSTDSNGGTTNYEYYSNGNVYKILYPDGTRDLYTYNSSWQVVGITDGEDHTTSYEYDDAGNVTCVRDALGNETRKTYDSYGNVLEVKDPNGNVTKYSYDVMGNCSSMTNALNQTYNFDYDKEKRMIKASTVTSFGIMSDSYIYDKLGRVVETINTNGNSSKIVYDSAGNVSTITDALGNVIQSNSYNNLNQLVSTSDALNEVTQYSYDAAGALTEAVECLNTAMETSRSFEYDEYGRLTSTTDPLNGESSYEYDNAGNVISQTDPNGGTTSSAYDSMGRVTSVVNAIGSESQYSYNASGLLEEAVNGRNQIRSYVYDAVGRISSTTDEAGTITYTYDKNGNVLEVEDENGSLTRQYDAMNRVTEYTDYNGNTVKYGYDELGNLLSLTYPGGKIVRYSYNLDCSLKTVTDWENRITKYGYDGNGRLTKVERPDGSTETYGYDVKGRLISQYDVKGTVSINSYIYEYDSAGNITNISDTESISSVGLDSSVMTYDAANRLITFNGKSVLYDEDGNMVYGPLKGVMTNFAYDCRNRLISAGNTSYEYDAENNRITVNEENKRIEYVVDSSRSLSQILVSTIFAKNTDGTYAGTGTSTLYVYGNGLISEDSEARGYLTYHFNQIGSTTAITDESGEVIRTFSYGAYGELLSGENEGIQFLYNGQYGIVTDSNGLYQMRSRYYNVDIKRFINQDVLLGSILDSQTMNRYSYVQGNPLNAMDPFGLCAANIFTKEFGHGVLDLLGFIPIIGDVADIANAFWYFSDHQYAEGFACIISALPGIGSFLGNGLKLTFKCSKYAIKTAGYIETGCKIFANSYTLAESSYYAVESGKKIYNTIQSGGTVDWRDGLGLAINIVTAVISGKGLASGIKEMNYVRTTEPVVCCFTAGTAILTSDENGDAAEKPIEDIQVGDMVYSTNPETGESAYKEVQQVFVSKTDVLVHIEVNGEDIQATVTHPFLVDGKWIAAKDLMAGDLLTLSDGTMASIEKIWYEKLTAPVLVYNFEVADFHTYYVGNSKVLVHNTCNKTGNTDEVGLGGNQSIGKGESGSNTLSTPSSKALRQNMIDAGNVVPDYSYAAHHIVAGSSPKAAEARAVIQKYGIDINDAGNGVFLPTAKNVAESAYHPSLHTNAYYNEINKQLLKATSKDDVLSILDDIAEQLGDGTFMK